MSRLCLDTSIVLSQTVCIRVFLTLVPMNADGDQAALLALQLSFQLPPSSYATMLIRELTKMATGTAFHKSLTKVLCF